MKTTPKPKKAAKAKYTFEIYSTNNQVRELRSDGLHNISYMPTWYWRCRHRNGHIVADGAEGYASKAKLLRALTRFRFGIETGDYEVREI